MRMEFSKKNGSLSLKATFYVRCMSPCAYIGFSSSKLLVLWGASCWGWGWGTLCLLRAHLRCPSISFHGQNPLLGSSLSALLQMLEINISTAASEHWGEMVVDGFTTFIYSLCKHSCIGGGDEEMLE